MEDNYFRRGDGKKMKRVKDCALCIPNIQSYMIFEYLITHYQNMEIIQPTSSVIARDFFI